jgi:hypothetical protein
MRDKELMSQEVGLDATTQDDWDMQRLGKTQQFKVRTSWNGSVGRGLISGREISDFIRFWDSRRR